MSRETFVPKNFHTSTFRVIEQANDIISEYDEQGFTLTLRQLYYQFVARGLIENTKAEYKRLGAVVNNGRLAGLIDWNTDGRKWSPPFTSCPRPCKAHRRSQGFPWPANQRALLARARTVSGSKDPLPIRSMFPPHDRGC